MTTYLLDANVLIALTVAEHEHHERASSWAAGIERFAVCPVVEGALVRFLVRMGEAPSVATTVLRGVRALPGCAFRPDALTCDAERAVMAADPASGSTHRTLGGTGPVSASPAPAPGG